MPPLVYLSRLEANIVAAGIAIPPRPSVVVELMRERTKPEPDLKRIAGLIAQDVGICAAVLRTVNSPLYGLRTRVDSIEHAVRLLGSKNVYALVTGLALRNALPAQGLARYYDQSSRTALIMAFLSERTGRSTPQDAHLFGLFHDCGIPLMMQRFPDYKDTLSLANAEPDRAFLDVENDRHLTNHVALGTLLAGKWQLPAHIQEAIRHHHDLGVFRAGFAIGPHALDLIALMHVAAIIENAHFRASGYGEWVRLEQACRDHLGLDEAAWAALLDSLEEAMPEALSEV